eukprot:GHVS01095365.1.p1 GENE.GHVS01095365.1~~GHVS01095365.1.p1  ORF type:complete len:134 (-),score=18.66 GHVS01095365.1:158-559(-)
MRMMWLSPVLMSGGTHLLEPKSASMNHVSKRKDMGGLCGGGGCCCFQLVKVAVLVAAILMPSQLLCHALSLHASDGTPLSTVASQSVGLSGQVNLFGSSSSLYLRKLIPKIPKMSVGKIDQNLSTDLQHLQKL